MAEDLFLRRTVIGGETASGDKAPGVGGHDIWNWSRALSNVPQRSNHRGRTSSLNKAKTLFRWAWDELKAELSHDQIRQARAIASDKSRPWQKRD